MFVILVTNDSRIKRFNVMEYNRNVLLEQFLDENQCRDFEDKNGHIRKDVFYMRC